MSISKTDRRVRSIRVDSADLIASLNDGTTLRVPLKRFPRLEHGTSEERANWCLIGGGSGIHWPDLDEDISAEGLLKGRSSSETENSFRRWLASRRIAS